MLMIPTRSFQSDVPKQCDAEKFIPLSKTPLEGLLEYFKGLNLHFVQLSRQDDWQKKINCKEIREIISFFNFIVRLWAKWSACSCLNLFYGYSIWFDQCSCKCFKYWSSWDSIDKDQNANEHRVSRVRDQLKTKRQTPEILEAPIRSTKISSALSVWAAEFLWLPMNLLTFHFLTQLVETASCHPDHEDRMLECWGATEESYTLEHVFSIGSYFLLAFDKGSVRVKKQRPRKSLFCRRPAFFFFCFALSLIPNSRINSVVGTTEHKYCLFIVANKSLQHDLQSALTW